MPFSTDIAKMLILCNDVYIFIKNDLEDIYCISVYFSLPVSFLVFISKGNHFRLKIIIFVQVPAFEKSFTLEYFIPAFQRRISVRLESQAYTLDV